MESPSRLPFLICHKECRTVLAAGGRLGNVTLPPECHCCAPIVDRIPRSKVSKPGTACSWPPESPRAGESTSAILKMGTHSLAHKLEETSWQGPPLPLARTSLFSAPGQFPGGERSFGTPHRILGCWEELTAEQHSGYAKMVMNMSCVLLSSSVRYQMKSKRFVSRQRRPDACKLLGDGCRISFLLDETQDGVMGPTTRVPHAPSFHAISSL